MDMRGYLFGVADAELFGWRNPRLRRAHRPRPAREPRIPAVVVHRRQQYPLRSADGPDGEQLAVPNAVVYGPPRHLQQPCRLVDGDAASKLLLEHSWNLLNC